MSDPSQDPIHDHSQLRGEHSFLDHAQDADPPISSAPSLDADSDPLLFENVFAPEPPQERIPHLGHVGLLIPVLLGALVIAALLARGGVALGLFGINNLQKAQVDFRYTLATEALLYFIALLFSWGLFPIVWHKTFFAGVHWNGFVAARSAGRLASVALLCFLLALVNGYLMPGPENSPIDRIFRQPGAAWLLFAFGVTVAPFFEELAYRGFLLPAICTGIDWIGEKLVGWPRRPVDSHGNPDWSRFAVVLGATLTSIPFALMHAYQTGYSLGPFLLLFAISMVLCAVRLGTRSLAASVFVHAAYNFLLFVFMLVGTGGFKHLENM